MVISPSGVVYPSCAAAWRFHASPHVSSILGVSAVSASSVSGVSARSYPHGAVSSGVVVSGCAVNPLLPSSSSPGSPVCSDALVAAIEACGLTAACLPPGVTSCMGAAFHSDTPKCLREYSLDYVDLFGPDNFARVVPPPVALAPELPPPALGLSPQLRQIAALRAVLPSGCERAMLGSEHSVQQASPEMCEEALMVKFLASAGPRGGAAARDRCDLLRYVDFCKAHANPPYFPVGSIVFPCFVKDAVRKSKGSKGGATVEYSIKTSFMHMKANYALPVDFEAPVMLNVIKPYKGDSDAATSPTQFMVDEWERLAVEGDTEAERLACVLAVLATWLTLRAAHFLDSTVHDEATVLTVILNLDRDKDGSRNVWAGCDAAGQRGPFTWWPAFMAAARLRGYLFPEIELPPSFAKPPVGDAAEPAVGGDAFGCAPDSGCATVCWGTKVTSAGLRAYFLLAFCLVGVPPARQLAEHFTGHSPRHFLPCFAEMLLWLQKFVDEVGRWATGAANTKRTKCGPRYTVRANRVMQLHLRRRLRAVLVALRVDMLIGVEGLVPCFSALSMSDLLTGHPYFGPNGVGFIPATFECS